MPAPAKLPGDWSQLSTGLFYACGVHTDGTGWCQGRNEAGQLGTPEPVQPTTPVQVPGSWRAIVAGDGDPTVTTCGIKIDRSAWCWGTGDSGQLGNDASASSATPVPVAGGHEWASLTVGARHVCGVDTDGAAWCWGANDDGRLADGTVVARDVPTRVTVPGAWASLDAGLQHTCGVQTDGAGWCWGWNDLGQLGNGTNTTTYYPEPVPTQLPGTWTDVEAGAFGSSGIRAAGSAWAWGQGSDGQLGDGSADPSYDPVRVTVLR